MLVFIFPLAMSPGLSSFHKICYQFSFQPPLHHLLIIRATTRIASTTSPSTQCCIQSLTLVQAWMGKVPRLLEHLHKPPSPAVHVSLHRNLIVDPSTPLYGQVGVVCHVLVLNFQLINLIIAACLLYSLSLDLDRSLECLYPL